MAIISRISLLAIVLALYGVGSSDAYLYRFVHIKVNNSLVPEISMDVDCRTATNEHVALTIEPGNFFELKYWDYFWSLKRYYCHFSWEKLDGDGRENKWFTIHGKRCHWCAWDARWDEICRWVPKGNKHLCYPWSQWEMQSIKDPIKKLGDHVLGA